MLSAKIEISFLARVSVPNWNETFSCYTEACRDMVLEASRRRRKSRRRRLDRGGKGRSWKPFTFEIVALITPIGMRTRVCRWEMRQITFRKDLGSPAFIRKLLVFVMRLRRYLITSHPHSSFFIACKGFAAYSSQENHWSFLEQNFLLAFITCEGFAALLHCLRGILCSPWWFTRDLPLAFITHLCDSRRKSIMGAIEDRGNV